MREGLQKILSTEDTIAALSTPSGRSAVGVVRVSGPAAEIVAEKHFRGALPLRHRQATVGRWLGEDGEVVDQVVVTLFFGPESYTGENVLEISAHGNPRVLSRILKTLLSGGARLATPGEFTLRAVTHGKMDLLQAEAVRNFVEAQTEAQAKMALLQMEGALSKRIGPSKAALLDVVARLEAGIDFAEDDVAIPVDREIANQVGAIRRELEVLAESYNLGRSLTNGLRVVILGRPNVGKSSLFNKLVGIERAIVTDIPGTTRDVVAESGDIAGIPLQFFDTAGVRQTADYVEQIGVTRTFEAFAEADLTILVVDGSVLLADEDLEIAERVQEVPHVVAANKMDLDRVYDERLELLRPHWISAKTGEGLNELREAIQTTIAGDGAGVGSAALLTSARQFAAVERTIRFLKQAESALGNRVPHEMVLLDLYSAMTSLGELTGEVTTEDILGRIFSTFCIGK